MVWGTVCVCVFRLGKDKGNDKGKDKRDTGEAFLSEFYYRLQIHHFQGLFTPRYSKVLGVNLVRLQQTTRLIKNRENSFSVMLW